MIYVLAFLISLFLPHKVSCLLVPAEPRATSVADSINDVGRSPRPTSGPLAVHAEVKRAHELFARSLSKSATCGYVSADHANPVTCPNGMGCGFWPANARDSISYGIVQGAVDCCPLVGTSFEFSSCEPATTCMNYNRQYNTGPYAITTDRTQICGYDDQICATFSFIGAPESFSAVDAQQTYTGLYCTNTATIQLVYQNPTNLPPSTSSISSLPSSTPSTTTPSTTTPSTTTPSTSSSQAPVPTEPSVHKNSSTNVGAIAGGTVGGVAALAIVAFVAWLYRRKAKARIRATPEISNYSPDMNDRSSYGMTFSPKA